MTRRVASTILVLPVLTAAAQARRPLPEPKLTKLLESDSATIESPALSPDGRWLAYLNGPQYSRRKTIWITPAGKSAPHQLTGGDYTDGMPIWFPTGDRIVFRSSRVDGALMVVGVNKATGEATEAPHRLTLDQAVAQYAVSRDGKWVAYATWTPSAPGPLRIIPSNGGSARTLDSLSDSRGAFVNVAFSSDGRSVEYVTMGPDLRQIARSVPVGGGAPRVLLESNPGTLVLGVHDDVVVGLTRGTGLVSIRRLTGDTLGTLRLEGLAAPRTRFGPASNTLLAVSLGGSSEVHVVSTDGSTPRAMKNPSANGYIGGFLTDDRVLVGERVGARNVIDIIPLAGNRPTQRISLPDSLQPDVVTTDGKLVYWKRQGWLGVYDVASGKNRVIAQTNVARSGGDYTSLLRSTDDYLYRQRTADGIELRAWSPVTNTSRLIRALAGARSEGSDFVIRGDLAVYSLFDGDSVRVFVARNPSSEPQRVVSVRGRHSDGISISRDGRHVVFGIESITGGDTAHAIGFVDLAVDGTLAGPARMVPTTNLTGITWLPNGEEVIYELIDASGTTSMMRLSSREGARPRVISRGENLHFWDFIVSPDGKWAAYPVQRVGPQTIWRVDFPPFGPSK